MPFCYGDEENACIHAMRLTTANQRDSQSVSRLCMTFEKIEFRLRLFCVNM